LIERMFIHASLELPIPAATAAQRLYATLHSRLPRGLSEISDEAYAAGLQMQTRVGPLGDTPVLSKKVRLELLEPISVADGLRVPLRWVATGVTGHLFPALDADLDITAIDEQRCELSINAVYTPPWGEVGARIDQLLLGRAARATMRSLLHGMGSSLMTSSPATPIPAPHSDLGQITISPAA
jgi:hypothetical protein